MAKWVTYSIKKRHSSYITTFVMLLEAGVTQKKTAIHWVIPTLTSVWELRMGTMQTEKMLWGIPEKLKLRTEQDIVRERLGFLR